LVALNLVATKTTFGHHRLAPNDQTYVNHHNLLVTKFISTTKDFSFCTTTNDQIMAIKNPLL